MDVNLIVLDSLRADYCKELKPVLKDRGFVEYEGAVSPAPWTYPSHVSIFTGNFPRTYVSYDESDPNHRWNMDFPHRDTLTRDLQKEGYVSQGFTANAFITPLFGFKFDEFHLQHKRGISYTPEESKLLNGLIKKKDSRLEVFWELFFKGRLALITKAALNETVLKALSKWPLDKGVCRMAKKIPKTEYDTFRFFNLMEPHFPYPGTKENYFSYVREHVYRGEPCEGSLEKKIPEGYKKSAEYTSRKLPLILKNINLESALTIITSDHGELLGEHGMFGHESLPFRELFEVPLFVKYPKEVELRGQPSDSVVSLTKLRPFINAVVKGESGPDSELFSKSAFIEVPSLRPRKTHGASDSRLEFFLKDRFSVYTASGMATYNATDSRFENFGSCGEVSRERLDELKSFVKFIY